MVSKDQAIGGAILLVCVLVAVFYIVTLFYPALLASILTSLGLLTTNFDIQFWIIAIPVFIAFIAIMFIGAWIGWTMATTPPPKPIEEITSEIEEKKEEPKTEAEAPKEPEAPTASPVEEKTAKKKK